MEIFTIWLYLAGILGWVIAYVILGLTTMNAWPLPYRFSVRERLLAGVALFLLITWGMSVAIHWIEQYV